MSRHAAMPAEWSAITLPGQGVAQQNDSRASTPVRILQVYAVILFVIPSFTVFPPVGAAGFPAGLLGVGALAVWGVWIVLGFHNPLDFRSPIRVAFGAVWATSLASYVLMQSYGLDPVEVRGADRWLLLLASITGVAFMASECLRSLDDVKRVLRAVMWGGAFCGFVGILQYFFAYDLAPTLGGMIPGFEFNSELGGIQFRGGLNRVAGTLLHPIELGTTASMLLPVAIYMAIYDRDVRRWKRVLPALLIGMSVPISVSRSAILAVAASMLIFISLLPPKQRVLGFAATPVAVAGVFLMARGVIATLAAFFRFGTSDPSVATRQDDYALVEQLVREHPWFGKGGGTYLPTNLLEILDNAYMKSVIEFGLVGLAVLIVFFFCVPAVAAFVARKRSQSPEVKVLAGALGSAVVSAAIASVTFDSLAFPVFTCVYALILGLIGALWHLTQSQTVQPVPGR